MHPILLELTDKLESTDNIFEHSINLLHKYNKLIVAESLDKATLH